MRQNLYEVSSGGRGADWSSGGSRHAVTYCADATAADDGHVDHALTCRARALALHATRIGVECVWHSVPAGGLQNQVPSTPR